MASPQIENGFTRIANEIMEALMRTNLSAYQGRVLMAIVRLTYGWQKKEDSITNKRIVELTGLNKAHASRTVSELVARNMVTKAGNKIGLCKDHQGWRELPIRVTVTNRGNRVTDWGNRLLPDGVTQKRAKIVRTGADEELKKRKKLIKRNTRSETDFSLFQKFYDSYPVHKGKQPAIKAFSKLDPQNGTLETILAAIESQKAYRDHMKAAGQWCPDWPYPATWLNERRWEDELSSEQSKPLGGLAY